MPKKVLAVDIDDVTADSTDAIRTLINKKLGVNLSPEEYRQPGEYWTYHEQIWERHGILSRINFEDIDRYMLHDQVELMQPINGVVERFNEIKDSYDIVFITSRDERYTDATKLWLETYLGAIHKDLHVIGNKRTSTAPKSKGQVCREIGAAYLVDDNPEHCLSALEHGSDAILFGDYGWHHDAPDSLINCKNWDEVYIHVTARKKNIQ